MEVLSLLTFLAERVTTSSSPRFVSDIARFVFPVSNNSNSGSSRHDSADAAPSTSSPSANAATARQSQFGVFSQLFVSTQKQIVANVATAQNAANNASDSKVQPKQVRPNQQPAKSMSKSDHTNPQRKESGADEEDNSSVVVPIPLAIVIAGAGHDWSSGLVAGHTGTVVSTSIASASLLSKRASANTADNTRDGGRNSLVDAIAAAHRQQLLQQQQQQRSTASASSGNVSVKSSSSSSSSRQPLPSYFRIIAVPNDSERVADAIGESAAAAHRFRAAQLASIAKKQSKNNQVSATGNNNNNNNNKNHAVADEDSASWKKATRGRVVCVFQMGESCRVGGEDLQTLAAALAECVACRERYHRTCHLDIAAVVVVRSPWHSSVLLGATHAPPLSGAIAARVFESDSSSGERTFPQLLFYAMKHFPFCVFSEATFFSLCVAWNAAHRMHDLVHALHRGITGHLRQFPDLEDEGNQANRSAVTSLLGFCLDSAAALSSPDGDDGNNDDDADDRWKNKKNIKGSHDENFCASSFTTLYYEVLVRRNIAMLQQGLPYSAGDDRTMTADQRRRLALFNRVLPLLPRIVRAGGNTAIAESGATAALLSQSAARKSSTVKKRRPRVEDGEDEVAEEEEGGQNKQVVNDDDDDDDDRGGEGNDDGVGELFEQLMMMESDEEEAEDSEDKKDEVDQSEQKEKGTNDQPHQQRHHQQRTSIQTPARQRQNAVPSSFNNGMMMMSTASFASVIGSQPSDVMAFPAVTFNSVKSFLTSPLRFEDSKCSDVVRLVCVLARHFRTGTTVTHLMDTLGSRRRTLIAIHEAAAAGIIFVRLDSGIVRLVV